LPLNFASVSSSDCCFFLPPPCLALAPCPACVSVPGLGLDGVPLAAGASAGSAAGSEAAGQSWQRGTAPWLPQTPLPGAAARLASAFPALGCCGAQAVRAPRCVPGSRCWGPGGLLVGVRPSLGLTPGPLACAAAAELLGEPGAAGWRVWNPLGRGRARAPWYPEPRSWPGGGGEEPSGAAPRGALPARSPRWTEAAGAPGAAPRALPAASPGAGTSSSAGCSAKRR